jgi:triphosphatase
MEEIEIKFQVPAEQSAALETALSRGTVQRTRLRARYFDTPDEALARHGLVLRLRQEGRRWVQTAKGPGQGVLARLEHDAEIDGGAAAVPDVDRHRGHPVHALLQEALASADGVLAETFQTDVARLARTMRSAGSSIEIALDRGHVRGGCRSQAVLEVEFELKQGSATVLVDLARNWCEKYGLWLDPLSKSGVGRRLANGVIEAPPTPWSPISDRGASLLPTVFEAALQQVLGNARELAAGSGGDGHVHQLRVGLRRVRTALRELEPLHAWTPLPPEVMPALHGLFAVLGAHRDRATLIPRLLRALADEGNPMREWQPDLPDLGAAIREREVQAALLSLVAVAQELRQRDALPPRALRKLARNRLARLHRTTLKEGRHFEDLAEPERHRVRKRLKRLRYLAELVRPVFRRGKVDDYVGALKELQDALGSYQDAAAGRRLLVQRAAEDSGAWFGVGWLAAREHVLAADCEQACRRVARRARPFWD